MPSEFIALIGVFVGGLITFIVTLIQNRHAMQIEKQKREWELEDQQKKLAREVREKRLDEIEGFIDSLIEITFKESNLIFQLCNSSSNKELLTLDSVGIKNKEINIEGIRRRSINYLLSSKFNDEEIVKYISALREVDIQLGSVIEKILNNPNMSVSQEYLNSIYTNFTFISVKLYDRINYLRSQL